MKCCVFIMGNGQGPVESGISSGIALPLDSVASNPLLWDMRQPLSICLSVTADMAGFRKVSTVEAGFPVTALYSPIAESA